MQNYNIHTHTYRCNHAVGTDEEYVLKAIEAGLKTLGFSDHVPTLEQQPTHDRMPLDQLQEYIDSILYLKKKYADKIDIKLGFECEYFESNIEHYKQLLEVADYLILGHHYPSPCELDFCVQADDERLALYADGVCKGLQSGLFTYLAHIDYFMLPRENWSPACTHTVEKILQCAIQTNTPIEINLKGMRYGKRHYDFGESFIYPNKKTIELIQHYKPRIVYGLDCHDPEHTLSMQSLIETFHKEYPTFYLIPEEMNQLKIK